MMKSKFSTGAVRLISVRFMLNFFSYWSALANGQTFYKYFTVHNSNSTGTWSADGSSTVSKNQQKKKLVSHSNDYAGYHLSFNAKDLRTFSSVSGATCITVLC